MVLQSFVDGLMPRNLQFPLTDIKVAAWCDARRPQHVVRGARGALSFSKHSLTVFTMLFLVLTPPMFLYAHQLTSEGQGSAVLLPVSLYFVLLAISAFDLRTNSVRVGRVKKIYTH